MDLILGIYRVLSPLLAGAVRLGAPLIPKLAATQRWRREAGPDLEALSALGERESRFWIHAASAGELEQARPLISALRRDHPGGGILLTISSSSARAGVERMEEVDLAIPLPLDTPRAMARLLDSFRPQIITLIKWDVWPNLVLEAAARKIPVLLLGAVLSPDSGRMRLPGRLMARPLHRRLTKIGAASEGDAEVFEQLGVPPSRITVTGDTRFERVLQRRGEDRPHPLDREPRGRCGCLIAGSTWPPEEKMLLEGFATLRAAHPHLTLILVPHEPEPHHLATLKLTGENLRLPLWVLSERPEIESGGICVVDRKGILPELYSLGDLALVGGGFGAGIHSVLEPAAWGLPILMGPGIGRADEARRLLEAGAAFMFNDGGELVELWRRFLESPPDREQGAEAATGFIAQGQGALVRSLALVDKIVQKSAKSLI